MIKPLVSRIQAGAYGAVAMAVAVAAPAASVPAFVPAHASLQAVSDRWPTTSGCASCAVQHDNESPTYM